MFFVVTGDDYYDSLHQFVCFNVAAHTQQFTFADFTNEKQNKK